MSEIVSLAAQNGSLTSTSSFQPLRIAQLAPLYESVPPKLYGGTERVVSWLTEELVRRGHDVTLYAAGDSKTSARLIPGFPKSLRLDGLAQTAMDGAGMHLAMLSKAFDHADEFDVIHAHVDYWSFPFARLVQTPGLSTIHGRLDMESIHCIYRAYEDQPLVSISDAQRTPLPGQNWIDTVYHGLPRDLLKFSPKGGNYLAFLGRIAPEKRPDLAIDAARRVGIPLKIAAKIDEVDREYFEREIAPKIKGGGVEYIGEITDAEKSEFLGNAMALLFSIDWPEPFGLVMVEALACGTPVIARPCGSVPEIIREGVTGFVAADFDDFAASIKKAENLSRADCRAEFERRFSVEVMTDKYEKIYRELIDIGTER